MQVKIYNVFPYTMSVHAVMSLVPVIRHRLQYTCSVYFSAHHDREWDERTFAVFAGASLLERRYGRKNSRVAHLNYGVARKECN